ncbi:MAG: squalene/phytoene synthase family protein, partial [Planctomycetaceae bacterium]|nr:squalene/phytoene synthase family protein [Planctomycetaceae bacterium]
QYGFRETLRRMEDFEEKFLKLITRQFERCEIYYTNAAPLYGLISPRSRKMFGIMWSTYYTLFQNIRRHPFMGNTGRARLSSLQRLMLLLRWKCLPCWKLK